jgi:lysophospholipase L1-like esterase
LKGRQGGRAVPKFFFRTALVFALAAAPQRPINSTSMNFPKKPPCLAGIRFMAAMLLGWATAARGQTPAPASNNTLHPAIFLVGDSIMKTGTGNGERGPWGWGYEFIPMFDSTKIHVYNEGRGGRSSRGYMEEGAWAAVLARVQPGDFVIIQFGHNDATNSQNYPDRLTVKGSGDETQEIESPVTRQKETIHTYGWYLRKMLTEIRAKGAVPIVLTLTIRDRWNKDGTIGRVPVPNLDLANTNRFTAPSIYSVWAAEVAKTMNVPVIDVHNLIADRYEKEGTNVVSTYFNNPRDPTHRNPLGAEVDATLTLAGLRALEGADFDQYLSEAGRAIPPAADKYIFKNAAAVPAGQN